MRCFFFYKQKTAYEIEYGRVGSEMFIRDRSDTMAIPDVQGSADTRQLAINKVGIKSIRHPVKVMDKSGGVQHTIAVFNMYVGLPHNFKGTHMSRFVEILNSHEREISVENFEPTLRQMVKRLEAETGHIEMTFPYFIAKKAPVSGVQSLSLIHISEPTAPHSKSYAVS